MTEDQAKVIQILVNLALKVVCALALLVGFFIILFHLFTIKEATDKWIFAALDAVLAGTIYPMTRHFFPAISDARKDVKKRGSS